ncbi:MFS transporter [Paraburkholderia bannensis]|uniref:hypothetical protein n=1 Tax=Paraburkholderia bannensis TaxID=765414 RepID=UPI002AB64E48|nr:hypothetical protein [Paraburkholderia bannensis]
MTLTSTALPATDLRRAQRRLTVALWVTNLASVIASNLSYLYLASLIYRRTHVIQFANVVLMCPMIIPVIACVALSSITRRVAPRSIFVSANAVALVTALVLAASLSRLPELALAGAALIGLIDALQRVTRIVAIKVFFPEGNAKFAVPVALSAQFAAGGFSGVLMAVAPHDAAPAVMLGAIAALFTLATAASLFLPAASGEVSPSTQTGGSLRLFVNALAQAKGFRTTFLRAVAFVGVFQGLYNLTRVSLPAHLLHLSDRYVGLLQLLCSLSMIAGAVVFYRSGRRNFPHGPKVEALLIGCCVIAVTAAVSWLTPVGSFALYCVFIVAFEFMFLQCQADLVENCPRPLVGIMATYQYAAMYVAMLAVMAAGNAASEVFSPGAISLACGVLYLLLRAAIALDGKRALVSPSH